MKYQTNTNTFSKSMNYFLAVFLIAITMQIQASSHKNQRNNCCIKNTVVDMATTSFAPDNPAACPNTAGVARAHQGLYNDLGYCSEETEDKIKISYPNVVYGFNGKTKQAVSSFWARKEHIVPLDDLSPEHLDALPSSEYAQDPTIVLTYPWKKFSVGTRFKHIPEDDTKKAYAIARIDHNTDSVVFDFIPKKNAIQEIKLDAQSARELFVKVIHDFVDRVTQSGHNNVIPYVWGGSSFTKPYQDEAFHKKDGAWHRNEKNNTYGGYDCSEFVMRMAKIAGIDFPWKTTSMIERSKRALNDEDQLENGDLIWVPGHIMIVSDIQNNEMIESRAYTSGYGRVHRIPLSESFDGVTTYDDLLERYFNHETIKFKNKDGSVTKKEHKFKLLKLMD